MLNKEASVKQASVANEEETLHVKRKKNLVWRYISGFGMEPELEENKGKNFLMRLLLREHWTDGTLIALKVDIFAGITLAVAQVAPCIAFALMGHGEPLVGLFSSFFLGIIPCVFGGRPGQITAIAGCRGRAVS
ncbi:Sulfate permease family, putative [Angomonas deanei]|uniref:Sulfate permease family, putative n=1 Tax=Angomonas deanei TaxID=59799 RepID=A0A7G2CG72_9TRYP|nr:Sulfate permease family, putative [Angomonas deanei]